MHLFQHIVSGDMASDSLRQALELDDADIVNMRDDLAVGPLGDVDGPALHRADFWRRVYGPEASEFEALHGRFEARLADTTAAFRGLPHDPRPCLIWHGSGATEQLTLRRACHFLADASRDVWAVEILPADHAPLPPHWCTAVAVQKPHELARIFDRRRRLSLQERKPLAQEWVAFVSAGHDDSLRHPIPGGVETRPITGYDSRVLAEMTREWERTVRVVGNTMGHAEDALISDAFIFWRVRELARAGKLELEPFDAGMRESRVRRNG